MRLFNEGIAQAALESQALVIDGGTQAGVMELMGLAIARQGYKPGLLGIAPNGKVFYPDSAAATTTNKDPAISSTSSSVGRKNRLDKCYPKSLETATPIPSTNIGRSGIPLDPNHTHFVLVKGQEFGDETLMLFALASQLGSGLASVLCVLVGGGKVAIEEVLHTIEHSWPILVIEGSGGIADRLASLRNQTANRREIKVDNVAKVDEEEDEEKKKIAKIISYDKLSFISFKSEASALRNKLLSLLLRPERQ